MAYWRDKIHEERSLAAAAWTEKMVREHADEIVNSIRQTVAYGGPDRKPETYSGPASVPELTVQNADSVTALFDRPAEERVCILNFADYKSCGGGYITGSHAQEAALCTESYLYNVLSAFKGSYYAWNNEKGSNKRFLHMNKGLYENRALYSPDIRFEYLETEHPGSVWVGRSRYADVITCASPNMRSGKATSAENSVAIEDRL